MPGTALRSTALAVLLCALLAIAGLNDLRFSTAAYTSQSTNTDSSVGADAARTPPTVSGVAPSAPPVQATGLQLGRGRRLGLLGQAGVALVQPGAHVVRRVGAALALVAGQDRTGRGDAGEAGQSEQLPRVHAP